MVLFSVGDSPPDGLLLSLGGVSALKGPRLRQAALGAEQWGLDACLFVFQASFCLRASARYFVSVCGLTSMPFSASLAIISGSSKPRFFIRSKAGASAKIVCLALSSLFPSRADAGRSLSNSCWMFLTCSAVIDIFSSP